MELEISRVGALVGDGARARMLIALMDGRALPAGKLALVARVSPQTASAHLSKLVAGRLLVVEPEGKHRYYRLAGPKVASLIEALSVLAPVPRLFQRDPADTNGLRFARSCYTHLAGHVGVELNDAAQRMGLWVPSRGKEYKVTEKGRDWLQQLGIHVNTARRGSARACLDWTERRHHVAGPLGTLLFKRFLELGWIARLHEGRAVRLTHRGRFELEQQLRLRLRRS
ncbi:MAG: transcriptional regulator [Acidobacteria bacterium]|nr:MAG: transcriptional regulator [Acidobacteriota bacterium]